MHLGPGLEVVLAEDGFHRMADEDGLDGRVSQGGQG